MENTLTIQCDAEGCGWSKLEHTDHLKQWHNAPCPSCGHAPVLSDEDMIVVAPFIGLRDLGMAAIGEGAKLDKPGVDVLINTRALRK
jgi:hypothetical protein